MNANQYLSNPTVPKGFYLVKCTDFDDQHGTWVIQLRIAPEENYGKTGGKVLHVTLRNTTNQYCQDMRAKFRMTFGMNPKGRFGCVLIDKNTYNGTKYSNPHFINQNDTVKRQSAMLYHDDAEGRIQW